jgi:hypothetical protein
MVGVALGFSFSCSHTGSALTAEFHGSAAIGNNPGRRSGVSLKSSLTF